MSSAFRLAEEGLHLDPRPEALSRESPLERAANIPVEELPDRLHELPPKEETVSIVGGPPWADAAATFLRDGGREAVLADVGPAEEWQPFRLWRPNVFLAEVLPQMTPGRALDLGCGAGREAAAMAGSGWSVVAADRLAEALDMGRDLARRYLLGEGEPPIEWALRDLERDGPPPGPYDLVTSFRYLDRALLRRVQDMLNPGGSVVVETFTTLHRRRHGRPRSDAFVLEPAELPGLMEGLHVRRHEEAWHGRAHTARIWASKPA
jgi:SAM-dependent methyltransferase